jgi:hypothetical protein
MSNIANFMDAWTKKNTPVSIFKGYSILYNPDNGYFYVIDKGVAIIRASSLSSVKKAIDYRGGIR